MSRFRIILSAGVCSIALSGCLPAAAGLALSAASLFTGGSGGKGGDGFRNPIDRQATEQQVRQALSRLNDQVDPACQASLDEYLKTHGTLTPGAPGKTAKPGTVAKSAPDAAPDAAPGAAAGSGDSAVKEQTPVQDGAPAGGKRPTPVNLLAKLEPQPSGIAGADVAVSADTASGVPSAESAVAAVPPGDAPPADIQPVKASLGTSSPAPGHCEHRLVCLPGTRKPTLMLMCPGKGDNKKDNGHGAATTTASDSPKTAPDGGDGTPMPQAEQATAALAPAAAETATVPPAAETAVPKTVSTETVSPASASASASPSADAIPTDPVSTNAVTIDLTASSATAGGQGGTPAAPAPQDETARQKIEGGGVSDWNWSFDPSKRF